MLHYLPIENEAFSPVLGHYRTFGLRVLAAGTEGDREIMILPEISSDFAFTLRLAALLTKKQVDPLRLLDAAEDLL